MASTRTESTHRIAEAIGRYVARHGDAADNVDGIRRWWLGGVLANEPVKDVQAALDQLVAESVLECRMLPDGGAVYAVRRAREP